MPRTKIGRPPLPPGERRVTLTVRVKPQTKERVEKMAKATKRSQGEVVDDVVSLHARGA